MTHKMLQFRIFRLYQPPSLQNKEWSGEMT